MKYVEILQKMSNKVNLCFIVKQRQNDMPNNNYYAPNNSTTFVVVTNATQVAAVASSNPIQQKLYQHPLIKQVSIVNKQQSSLSTKSTIHKLYKPHRCKI